MFWIVFSFSIFVFSASVFAEISNVKYGGQIASHFVNRTGGRASCGFMSGYGWVEAQKDIDNVHAIKLASGWSYEQANKGAILINHTEIEYGQKDYKFVIGRSLSAAGKLHHDLSDFGAPGAGLENNPNSAFFAGSFSSNVAQQIAKPYANRVSFYMLPYKMMALGISYAPQISKDHPANYQFYTKADHKHEISIATAFETFHNNRFLGITFGATESRYSHDRNFLQYGNAQSRQMSMYYRHDKTKNKYHLYEAVWGCLRANQLGKDCRAGWQISEVTGRWIKSTAYKKRVRRLDNYEDYGTGYMYKISNNTNVGLESIFRVKQNQQFRDGDFHWNFGISHHF